MLQFLGDILTRLLPMLPFHGLFATFMHYAQTAQDIDTISFAYDRSCPSLAYVGQPLPPKFCPKVTHPDTQWQNAAEWLQIAQWSQRRAYRKPLLLF